MKGKILFSTVAISAFILAGCASNTSRYPASERGGGGGGERAAPAPRAHAAPDPARDRPVVDHNGHPVVDNNNHEVHAPVQQDPRPANDIRNHPTVRTVNYHDVRVTGHWNAYYPAHGWFTAWGESPSFSWNRVSSVTCEAVNVASNEIYPTSGLSSGGWVWSDSTVDTLLGEALDDCDTDPNGARDVSGAVSCVPASPACTPTYNTWVGSVF